MRSILATLALACALLFACTGSQAQNCSGTPAANTVCAGPPSGAAGFPGFRALVPADGVPVLANPTATIGLTPVNGTASTAMRSDAAPALPVGVPTNTLNNPTLPYTIQTSDCGKTIQVAGPGTLTLPSVSGFTGTCRVEIKNTSTTRAVLLSGFPSGMWDRLWPTQATAQAIVNGAWHTLVRPPRWQPTSALTLNIDTSVGSDSNDGLSTGSGNALATWNKAMTLVAQQIDNLNGVTFLSAASQTYPNDVNFTAQGYVGGGCITIDGNSSSLSIQTGFANLFFNKISGGCWAVRRFTLNNVQVGGVGLYAQQIQNVIVQDGMVWNLGTNAIGISSIGSWVHCSNNLSITGSWATWAAQTDFGKVECSNITITLTGTPNWSTAFIVSHGAGAIIDVGSNVYSGSATGSRCSANLLGLIDSSGSFGSLPGNSACTVASGAIIN